MRDEATQRQIDAARPGMSTWLSANAGSGKTRVLTDRVARLLLKGASPQNILCLTYTKAAATEMQNRLFSRLGAWAMSPDEDLRQKLDELGAGDDLSPGLLAAARRLFARAIETPGGLRIQTIHSFCAVLLRRFPLECGVSPQFTEMDDRVAGLLRGECLEELSETHPHVMEAVALHLTDQNFDTLAAEVARGRDRFAAPRADLRTALGLPPGLTREALLAEVFQPDTEGTLQAVLQALAASDKPTDAKLGQCLAALAPPWSLDDLVALEGPLLLSSTPYSAKIGKVPTKAVRDAMGPERERFEALMARVETARERRLALAAAEKAEALHAFADAFLPLYARRKEARGWLDFDDLILKARDLLTVRDVADWVLFRLDGGIDHILVDEAQDTSPTQWQVIEALASEFAAGHGARRAGERTIFVVGDVKQSIYSFQGADPAGFDRMHDRFKTQLGQGLQRMELRHSFRSAAAVLDTVDTVFSEAPGRGPDPVKHVAFHADRPGRVDLWPLYEASEKPEDPDWDDPRDTQAAADAVVELADAIARHLKGLIDAGTAIPGEDGAWRPLHDGDILILVQRRSALFHQIIRACKAAGLKVAGADRLKLGEALAVRDIVALLSFLATPADDLSLAAALRSPLFGWSEAELYALAQGREGTLWSALQSAGHPETRAVLRDLRDHADYLRPYELIERILVRHEGRARLVGRLGVESEEAIDALLAQALGYETTGIPSLTGFLAWFEAEDVELKRQPDAAGRRLRVMSVHGAKGLEAPLVVLPDTVRRDRGEQDHVIFTDDGLPFWRQGAGDQPEPMRRVIEERKAARQAESARLLYVAMTRAEKWLIVCGTGDAKIAANSWYGDVETALGRMAHTAIDTPVGQGRRIETLPWAPGPMAAHETAAATIGAELPAWYDTHAATPVEPPRPISPSGLPGAKALPGEVDETNEEAVLTRGTRLHALLEHLRPERPDLWRKQAEAQLDGLHATDPGLFDELLNEASAVLASPGLAPVFAPHALAEVDVTAPHPSGRVIFGTIDRLLVDGDRFLAVDFKSNRTVPDSAEAVPEGLLAQMGAYAAALSQVYPRHRVETALLWTATATLMPLPGALLRAAFEEAARLDG